jgi:general nucleoside transport system permease protein
MRKDCRISSESIERKPLFSFLQVMGIQLQGIWPSIPSQVFQVAPFPLMIFTLALMHTAKQSADDGAGGAFSRLRRLARS